MSIELIPLDKSRKVLSPGDRGFVVSLAKSTWNKQASTEALKFLKNYTYLYHKSKINAAKSQTEEEQEPKEETEETEEPSTAPKEKSEVDHGIEFVHRELVYNNCGFVASNLADPSDYAHFVLSTLGDLKKDAKTRYPFRIMPVQEVCEARPRAIERALVPLMEKVLGTEDLPHRFSILYRGIYEGNSMTPKEAEGIIRNCVWAVNPQCVQCIKYQDYAITYDILAPLLCVGLAKDFQKLVGYNTWSIRQGPDLTDMGEDSEDDISDNPDLEEEEEMRRKLRIKRKRRAEKAALARNEEKAKRKVEEMEEDEDKEKEEDDHEEEGEEEEQDDENGMEDDGEQEEEAIEDDENAEEEEEEEEEEDDNL